MKDIVFIIAPTLRYAENTAIEAGLAAAQWKYVISENDLRGSPPGTFIYMTNHAYEHVAFPRISEIADSLNFTFLTEEELITLADSKNK